MADTSELTSATSVESFRVVFHIQKSLRTCADFWAAPVNLYFSLSLPSDPLVPLQVNEILRVTILMQACSLEKQ